MAATTTREECTGMAKYYVTKVHKEYGTGKDGKTHEHITGVFRDSGEFSTNQEVVDSIAAGNDWYTRVSGEPDAKIKPLGGCFISGCSHKPYLTTEPDHTTKNNLEALPRG
jgi:hypothetical protein